MSTYVLIHGAWHGGWCWDRVRSRLEQAGHTVATPDLPGHGDDKTPTAAVSLDAYAARVCDVLDAQAEPVVLVGHSMGGVVVTAAAERRPEAVRALVYLCAFLPGDGVSLMMLAGADQTSLVLPNLEVSEQLGYATVRDEGIVPAFYGRCSADDAAWAKSRLVPQALPAAQRSRHRDARNGPDASLATTSSVSRTRRSRSPFSAAWSRPIPADASSRWRPITRPSCRRPTGPSRSACCRSDGFSLRHARLLRRRKVVPPAIRSRRAQREPGRRDRRPRRVPARDRGGRRARDRRRSQRPSPPGARHPRPSAAACSGAPPTSRARAPRRSRAR